MDTSETKQCTLLFQTTDYNSSQANLDIFSETTALLRYDMHHARIDKQLCSKVHALPNLAVGKVASQSSHYNDSGVPAAASRAIDGLLYSHFNPSIGHSLEEIICLSLGGLWWNPFSIERSIG